MTLATRFVPFLVLAASSAAHANIVTVNNIGGFDESFAPAAEQGAVGVFAHHTDGSIWNHVFTDPSGQPVNHELRWGTRSFGVAAVSDGDPKSAPTYVFSAESDGLWYLRVTSMGAAWDSWCHVDTRADLTSEPSAVYIGNGNIRIYAMNNAYHLVQWRITPTANSCTPTHGDVEPTLISTRPVATSWGPGRVDVFSTWGDHLVHAYKLDYLDDRLSDQLQVETSFWVDGAYQQLKLEPERVSAAAPAYQTLDVLYRATDFSIRHLYWRQSAGFLTRDAMPSSVDHFEIDATTDQYSGPTFITHSCVDLSDTPQPMCGSGGIDSFGELVSHSQPTFFVNYVYAMHGFTLANRFFFVVDAATDRLVYSKGDLYSGY